MKITFLGATKTVTGSNFLLEAAGKKIIIDCGLYQGKALEERENYEDFAYNVHDIDFMLLTHAHIDHSGRFLNYIIRDTEIQFMQQKQHVICVQ